MSKFNTTIKKLNKIWENVEKNRYNLDDPIILKRILVQNHILKPVFTIYDSDWQTISIGREEPGVYRTRLTDKKDSIIIHDFPYLFRTSQLQVPPEWIPFLNTSIYLKTIPTTETVTIEEFDVCGTSEDVQLFVNGLKIFQGSFFPTPPIIYTQNDVDNGVIDITSAKKAWVVPNEGNVKKFRKVFNKINADVPCSSFENYEEIVYDCNLSKHEITGLTKTQIIGVGDHIKHEWVDLGDGCEEQITYIVNKGSITTALDTGTLYFFDDPPIIVTGGLSESPTHAGYWLYFGTNKVPPRVENHLFDGFLTPIEDVGEIIRNPTRSTIRCGREINRIISQNFGIIRPTNAENIIQIQSGGWKSIKAKATQKNTFETSADKYTYTWGIGHYNESIEEIIGSIDRYTIPDQDIQIKFVVILKNPFYYRTEATVQS